MKSGIELIADERRRQIEAEGYDAAHDDLHNEDELVRAAVYYLDETTGVNFDVYWPWQRSLNKRSTYSRQQLLIVAGALIAAELDRVIRLEDGDSEEEGYLA